MNIFPGLLPENLQRLANQAAGIEKIKAREKWLQYSLKISDDELEKANKVAEAAINSGSPDYFLATIANMIRKPIFLPCNCWWCKLKRAFERK